MIWEMGGRSLDFNLRRRNHWGAGAGKGTDGTTVTLVEQMAAGEVNQDPSCKITYISHLGKRMIIDSKWSFLQRYMSFQEEIIRLRKNSRSWSSNQKCLGMQFFRTSPANYFCESPWPKKTSKGKMCFYFMFFPDSVEMLLAAKLYSKVWIGHSKECSKQKDFRWLFEALGVGFGIFGLFWTLEIFFLDTGRKSKIFPAGKKYECIDVSPNNKKRGPAIVVWCSFWGLTKTFHAIPT